MWRVENIFLAFGWVPGGEIGLEIGRGSKYFQKISDKVLIFQEK